MPVVAIAEYNRMNIRQIKIYNGDCAYGHLTLVAPSSLLQRMFCYAFYIGCLCRLVVLLLPNGFTAQRARKARRGGFLGGNAERFAAKDALLDWHCRVPVRGALALSIGVPAGARTKASLTARLAKQERLFAKRAYSLDRLSRVVIAIDDGRVIPSLYSSHSLDLLWGVFTTTHLGCDFSNVLRCLDHMLTAVNRLFTRNHVRTSSMCARVLRTWHSVALIVDRYHGTSI